MRDKSQYQDYGLGMWVSQQRGKKDQLSQEQIKRLNDLGFVWDVFEYQWEEGFKHLVAYQKEFGDCLVKSVCVYQKYNLGAWVIYQRKRKDKLSLEKVKRLDALGFVWKRNWPSTFQTPKSPTTPI